MSSKTSFTEFIREILRKHGKLNEVNVVSYTNPKAVKIYKNAFTHYSYDSKSNYERLEFVGDGTIDGIIVVHLRERFPQIEKEGVLARMKIVLKCGKKLGKFGHDMGFFKWTRFNPGFGLIKKAIFHTLVTAHPEKESYTEEDVKKFYKKIDDKFIREHPEEFDEYNALMEDVFEAFIGAVMTVIDEMEPRGVAYAVAYNIVTSLLEKVDIKLTKEYLMDPKSRLKEVYYNQSGTKEERVDINRMEKCFQDTKTQTWTVNYLYIPRGGKGNAEVLGTGTAKSKDLAKKNAAVNALENAFKLGYKEMPLKIK